MRCKSCLQIFSQPSMETKRTRTCAVCRGVIRAYTKRKEMCEKTEKILLNRSILQKIRKKIILTKDHFIAGTDLNLRPMRCLENEL